MRLAALIIAMLTLSGCGNLYFSARTVNSIQSVDADNFTITTLSDYGTATTCLVYEAVRHCATQRSMGVAIVLLPTGDLSNTHEAKANVTCTGAVNQKLLERSIDSGC